jgi:hypothetical protein
MFIDVRSQHNNWREKSLSLPQKKRGFRRIIVQVFVNINFDDPWLQEFETRMQRNSHPITPAFIAYAIQEVIRLGWNPEDYKSYTAKYESGKFILDD